MSKQQYNGSGCSIRNEVDINADQVFADDATITTATIQNLNVGILTKNTVNELYTQTPIITTGVGNTGDAYNVGLQSQYLKPGNTAVSYAGLVRAGANATNVPISLRNEYLLYDSGTDISDMTTPFQANPANLNMGALSAVSGSFANQIGAGSLLVNGPATVTSISASSISSSNLTSTTSSIGNATATSLSVTTSIGVPTLHAYTVNVVSPSTSNTNVTTITSDSIQTPAIQTGTLETTGLAQFKDNVEIYIPNNNVLPSEPTVLINTTGIECADVTAADIQALSVSVTANPVPGVVPVIGTALPGVTLTSLGNIVATGDVDSYSTTTKAVNVANSLTTSATSTTNILGACNLSGKNTTIGLDATNILVVNSEATCKNNLLVNGQLSVTEAGSALFQGPVVVGIVGNAAENFAVNCSSIIGEGESTTVVNGSSCQIATTNFNTVNTEIDMECATSFTVDAPTMTITSTEVMKLSGLDMSINAATITQTGSTSVVIQGTSAKLLGTEIVIGNQVDPPTAALSLISTATSITGQDCNINTTQTLEMVAPVIVLGSDEPESYTSFLGANNLKGAVTNISSTEITISGPTLSITSPVVDIPATTSFTVTSPEIQLDGSTTATITAPEIINTATTSITQTAPTVTVDSTTAINLTSPEIDIAGEVVVIGTATATNVGMTGANVQLNGTTELGIETPSLSVKGLIALFESQSITNGDPVTTTTNKIQGVNISLGNADQSTALLSATADVMTLSSNGDSSITSKAAVNITATAAVSIEATDINTTGVLTQKGASNFTGELAVEGDVTVVGALQATTLEVGETVNGAFEAGDVTIGALQAGDVTCGAVQAASVNTTGALTVQGIANVTGLIKAQGGINVTGTATALNFTAPTFTSPDVMEITSTAAVNIGSAGETSIEAGGLISLSSTGGMTLEDTVVIAIDAPLIELNGVNIDEIMLEQAGTAINSALQSGGAIADSIGNTLSNLGSAGSGVIGGVLGGLFGSGGSSSSFSKPAYSCVWVGSSGTTLDTNQDYEYNPTTGTIQAPNLKLQAPTDGQETYGSISQFASLTSSDNNFKYTNAVTTPSTPAQLTITGNIYANTGSFQQLVVNGSASQINYQTVDTEQGIVQTNINNTTTDTLVGGFDTLYSGGHSGLIRVPASSTLQFNGPAGVAQSASSKMILYQSASDPSNANSTAWTWTPEDLVLGNVYSGNITSSGTQSLLSGTYFQNTAYTALDSATTSNICNDLSTLKALVIAGNKSAGTRNVKLYDNVLVSSALTVGTTATITGNATFSGTINNGVFNRVLTHTGATATNYLIATLAASTSSTYDALNITAVIGGWSLGSRVQIDLFMQNRNGFEYWYTLKGDVQSTWYSSCYLSAYSQTNGTVLVYVNFPANQYGEVIYTISSNTEEAISLTTTSTATLAGTLVFSCAQPTVYPPLSTIDKSGNLTVPSLLYLNGHTKAFDGTLAGLNDVTETGLVSGQYLTYNGANWVNTTLPAYPVVSLANCTDVTESGLVSGQYLTYNGTKWTNTSLPAYPVVSLATCTDVTETSLTNGQYLMYNGTKWVNSTLPTPQTISIASCIDVSESSNANGDVMTWNSSSSKWVNQAVNSILGNATHTYIGNAPTGMYAHNSLMSSYYDSQSTMGWFVCEDFNTVIMGMANSSSSTQNGIPANTYQACLSFGSNGSVYTRTGTYVPGSQPGTNRNVLDNGSGGASFQGQVSALSLNLNGCGKAFLSTLASLYDVLVSSPTQGQVLGFNSSSNTWVNQSPSSTFSSMLYAPSIQATNSIIAQSLLLNGSATAFLGTLETLSNVLISGLQSGQVLSYNGSNWVNSTVSTTTASTAPQTQLTLYASNGLDSVLTSTSSNVNTIYTTTINPSSSTTQYANGTPYSFNWTVPSNYTTGGSLSLALSGTEYYSVPNQALSVILSMQGYSQTVSFPLCTTTNTGTTGYQYNTSQTVSNTYNINNATITGNINNTLPKITLPSSYLSATSLQITYNLLCYNPSQGSQYTGAVTRTFDSGALSQVGAASQIYQWSPSGYVNNTCTSFTLTVKVVCSGSQNAGYINATNSMNIPIYVSLGQTSSYILNYIQGTWSANGTFSASYTLSTSTVNGWDIVNNGLRIYWNSAGNSQLASQIGSVEFSGSFAFNALGPPIPCTVGITDSTFATTYVSDASDFSMPAGNNNSTTFVWNVPVSAFNSSFSAGQTFGVSLIAQGYGSTVMGEVYGISYSLVYTQPGPVPQATSFTYTWTLPQSTISSLSPALTPGSSVAVSVTANSATSYLTNVVATPTFTYAVGTAFLNSTTGIIVPTSTVNTIYMNSNGSAAQPCISWASGLDGGSNTGIWHPADDKLAISCGSTNMLAIELSGTSVSGLSGPCITSAGELVLNNGLWFRSQGNCGWYNQTYQGGVFMQDSTWLRSYNNKPFYTGGKVRADGGFYSANADGSSGGVCMEGTWGNLYFCGGGTGNAWSINTSGGANAFLVSNNSGGTAVQISNSIVYGGIGYRTRNGTGGTNGSFGSNTYNWYWDGTWFYGIVDSSIICKFTVGSSVSSDYRLKRNIEDLTIDGLSTVMKLRPVSYQFKPTELSENDRVLNGFIAHELQEQIPAAVVGAKDAVDDHGNDVTQTVDPTAIISVVVKAVQELNTRLQAENNDLKNRLATLEEQMALIMSNLGMK